MNPTLLRFLLLTALLGSLYNTSSFARPVPNWTFEKLAAESDLVVILQPLENRAAKDLFPGTAGSEANQFIAMDTRFRVEAGLKTKAGPPPTELTVLHFLYSTNIYGVSDGALLARFVIGPVQSEKKTLKDGKPVRMGTMKPIDEQPTWLAFLKRRTDGRFEPVTGQMDSAFSFRELDEVTFSVPGPSD